MAPVSNSKNIFKHLCDQMDKLNLGTISVEDAKAQANLAKQANNVLRHELDRALFISKYGSENLREIEDIQP